MTAITFPSMWVNIAFIIVTILTVVIIVCQEKPNVVKKYGYLLLAIFGFLCFALLCICCIPALTEGPLIAYSTVALVALVVIPASCSCCDNAYQAYMFICLILLALGFILLIMYGACAYEQATFGNIALRLGLMVGSCGILPYANKLKAKKN